MKTAKPDTQASTELQFHDLLKQAPVALLVVKGPNLVVDYINDMYLQIVDKKAADLLGCPILEAIPEFKGQGYEDLLLNILKTGETVKGHEMSATFTRHGERINAWFDFVYQPLYETDGGISGVIMAGNEVTDLVNARRKATESEAQYHQMTNNLEELIADHAKELINKNRELIRSEARYHQMTAEVEDYAILLLTPEGNIDNWNKGAEKIKGYKAEEIIGKNFRLFYGAEDRAAGLPEQLINLAITTGKASHEGWRIRKDGTKFWGSIVITALHDSNNELIGFSKVTRDLTERKMADDQRNLYAKQLEQKNRDLERSNNELSSFSYVASHDLQEPLRKIQAFGNLILNTDASNLSQQGKDYFERMIKAAGRMQNLIDSLLEFSRTSTTSMSFEKTDLNVLLDEVKKDMRELIEETHTVVQSVPLPTLNIITFQVKQLLFNLINNAIKYTTPGEHPVIRIHGAFVNGHHLNDKRAEAEAGYYQLSVSDNGIGFEQEYADKIFELFQRLHGRNEYSGSGIGLAICKKIAENHHGFIKAESKPGKGSTFHFYIPVGSEAGGRK